MKKVWVGVMLAALVSGSAAEARDNTAAILGGVAAGALGGAVLGTVLSNRAQAQPAPVYVQPAPPPTIVEVERPRPMVRTVVASPYDDQAFDLKDACDHGNRHACIRFGIMIGKHQERVATWRRTHPDFFSYED
ncbi:hypothetical protein [Lichenifustis flavocetrariae]|uniref:Uncharacterized protein n=1 Tax=Lichenifustis flavocetrariae TaxID=2949735 RepID=A0AA41YX37_9HYPH|nr:hypothetical protein [Lichenifustis flavocetrariae]MCW6508895.1 hypothetical protein [Lichenifustis flavocetrariae]